MLNKELIAKLVVFKEIKNYTLHDLSRILDLQTTTIERWLKTGRINKVYARMLKEKLQL